MYQTHHFNIGSPENMVHINELLDILQEKLEKYVPRYFYSVQIDLTRHTQVYNAFIARKFSRTNEC